VILTEGAAFCPHHLRLAEVYGADRVRRGAVPKKRAFRFVEEPEPPISLLEGAESAAAPVWLTVECPKCGERSRVAAPVQRS
jgi:hypothetical protein